MFINFLHAINVDLDSGQEDLASYEGESGESAVEKPL